MMSQKQTKGTKQPMIFSEQLILLRKKNSLTQEDLADAVGVSRQSVSKWETGESYPDLPKLMGLADTLHVSMDVLCGRSMEAQPASDTSAEGSERSDDSHTLSAEESSDILPAQEDHTRAGRRRRLMNLLLAVLIAAAAGTCGYLAGRAGRQEQSTSVQKEFPTKFMVHDLQLGYDGKDLSGFFIPNYQSDTVSYVLALKDLFGNTKEVRGVCEDGKCIFRIPYTQGTGQYLELTVRERDIEQNLKLADNISVNKRQDTGKWVVTFGSSVSY